uniref:G-protein coupled receptors family 1 profile domain-containing protein n=1 Tax=Panagrolaimus sp. JU765 TaxID=591449 RepID=A0AC34QT09_9BILA
MSAYVEPDLSLNDPEYLSLPNCTYRYDYDHESNMLVRNVSVIIDGPITLLAAVFALVGAHFSIKFLRGAGLNRDLTAALYSLAICDAFLIFTVVLYHSIEATSLFLFDVNVMWNKQKAVLITYGLVSLASTVSTLLVVIITLQRFCVVWWPLYFNNYSERSIRSETNSRKVSNSYEYETKRTLRTMVSLQMKNGRWFTKNELRPYLVPFFVIICSTIVNLPVFFEFHLEPCIFWQYFTVTEQLTATEMRLSQAYNFLRTVIMMATQTVGPIIIISCITCATEYKVYKSLQARRRLFESQNRRRSIIILEELRETMSRAVAIFIAVKFLLLRSLPIFFDLYETIHGIDSFGTTMTLLVRISDFAIVLNSATNSLAYFGRKHWLENKLKERILRKHKNSSQLSVIRKQNSPTMQNDIAEV